MQSRPYWTPINWGQASHFQITTTYDCKHHSYKGSHAQLQAKCKQGRGRRSTQVTFNFQDFSFNIISNSRSIWTSLTGRNVPTSLYEHSTSQNCHPKSFWVLLLQSVFPLAVLELPRLSLTSKELLLSLFTESLAVPLVFPSYTESSFSVVIGFLEG